MLGEYWSQDACQSTLKHLKKFDVNISWEGDNDITTWDEIRIKIMFQHCKCNNDPLMWILSCYSIILFSILLSFNMKIKFTFLIDTYLTFLDKIFITFLRVMYLACFMHRLPLEWTTFSKKIIWLKIQQMLQQQHLSFLVVTRHSSLLMTTVLCCL